MTRPFFAWPGWVHLRFAWLLSALNGIWFAFVYGGCNWITAHRSWRVRLDLPGELGIPFVPGMTAFYMSIYLLFVVGPFIVRERREFAALIVALAAATFCGGLGFILLPAQPAYLPLGDLGVWAGLFHFADRVNLDYNMLPSLHVALSVCCVAVFCEYATALGRGLLWGWAVAIALSTLLIHQHHLADVVSGWALGVAMPRIVKRMANPAHQSRRYG